MTAFPESLVRFRDELEGAIRRERALRRRRRRRLAVAVCAAAAVAAGALAAQRAAAALAAAPGSIVHVDMLVTQQNPDGSQTSWREQRWQLTAPPYDTRRIVTPDHGRPVETATVDGNAETYDPQTDTVYVGGPPAEPQPATAEPYRDQIVDLLESGKLTETGRSTVDGRPVLSFTSNDGYTRYDYTVDAATYAPVRWRFSPLDDATPAATVDFRVYETLSAGATQLDLARLHPDATVQRRS